MRGPYTSTDVQTGREFDLCVNQYSDDVKIQDFIINLTTKSKYGEIRHDTPVTLGRLRNWCSKRMPNSGLCTLITDYMKRYYPLY